MNKLSVILPVYNAEKYIAEAIESILTQSYQDFEFIIINDGSTDRSLDIIQSYADQDSRIQLVSRDNKGLIFTLNEAISLAKGDFIARMDADDISLPNRFEQQIKYLDEHPKTAVVGTGYRYMDEAGVVGDKRNVFTAFEDIKASFYFTNPIAHPSVMINYRLLGSEYCYLEQYKTIEDLELWFRISANHEIVNLAEVLLHYRVLDSSITGSNLQLQISSAAKMVASKKPLSHFDDGLELARITYSYTTNSSTYSEFLKACLKLNIHNFKFKYVRPFNLFKRSLISLVLWRRKNIRS